MGKPPSKNEKETSGDGTFEPRHTPVSVGYWYLGWLRALSANGIKYSVTRPKAHSPASELNKEMYNDYQSLGSKEGQMSGK